MVVGYDMLHIRVHRGSITSAVHSLTLLVDRIIGVAAFVIDLPIHTVYLLSSSISKLVSGTGGKEAIFFTALCFTCRHITPFACCR
ncbi:hypothetical protein IEQ34_020535 [Dendrobium chrysotoxum]|uniref:Uncharacterized protein n=1 Tax=Dendrobium chrysotoxum TaxID=161865 RepID=A0AAV7G290_DENCH|nr:hypothetical protein IEQ34_020535 [Dendrobium chrysotoxum]